jgi:hypothetical protein
MDEYYSSRWGPPPHYHSNEDETFHVLEGREALFADGQWREVGPGSAAFMPRVASFTHSRTLVAVSHVDHDHALRLREVLLRVALKNSRSPAAQTWPGSPRLAPRTEFISCCSQP